jgi:hypothetical protein
MVNISKEQKGDVVVVRIAGSIEESVNFDQLIGPPPKEMHVICKEIVRINSIGVKAWIQYFQKAEKNGTILKFLECSTAFVEQVNLISNFTCGGTVESVQVPFSCNDCHSELSGLFKSEDLKKYQGKLPDLKCPKCDGTAVFDDIPEQYLGNW